MTAMQSYQADAITTASPSQLVLMMYEATHAAVGRAIDAGPEHPTFDSELDRSARILAEMRGVLDHERGGEIAANLSSLYTFCIDLLCDAVEDRTADPLHTVEEIVGTLRDAWAEAVC
jgi:flagellar secretion chaperone FliS